MIVRFILMLGILGLVFGGIFVLKKQQFEEMAAQQGPQPPAVIAAAEVRTDDWRPHLNAVGSLVAVQGIFVTNEAAGKVRAIYFRSGEEVSQGDVLLELDDSVDQANLEGALAGRRLAEVRFNRLRDLLEKNAVSQADYDEARANLDNAEAQVSSQRELLQQKQIRAPFSGRLGIRQVDVGEYLSPGSPIVPLESLNPIYVDYSLPEKDLNRISVGQELTVTVKAWPDRVFRGEISAINPGIDPETRNVRIRGTLQNPEQLLRPGMFAQVNTLLPLRENVPTLPRTAITYATYGQSVFLIREEGDGLVVESRQVVTGDVRDGRVEIVSGLEVGDRVVSAGQNKLRNGQPVRIDNSIELDRMQVIQE